MAVNSAMTRDDLAARGVEPGKIHVLPFGVDAERFRPPSGEERARARQTFDLSQDDFVALFVGAHGPRKGLPEALGAYEGIRGGERLLVAGEHRSGRWAALARERKLPVVMPGKVPDILPAYWAADVLLYPSRYDAFGMAVLEAMACGLPVIVSVTAGSHEIVGDAGIVLNERNPRHVRAALDRIRDDPWRAEMGARGRAIALTRTWDETGAMLLNLYPDR